MSVIAAEETVARPRIAVTLLPIMGVVFVAFLVIGLACLYCRFTYIMDCASGRLWLASSPAASSLLP